MRLEALLNNRASTVPTLQAFMSGQSRRGAQDLLIRAMDSVLTLHDRAQERRRLARLDDRLLRDIGLDRATADTEAGKPFWRS